MRFFTLLVLVGLVGFVMGKWLAAASSPPTSLFARSPQGQLLYADGFETETNWQKFEEIVGGSSCYGAGIGTVERSMDVAAAGQYSLRVWANQALSLYSNHLIGYKEISATGQTGILTYQLQGYIAGETANEGQTGPEFSMQNTRYRPANGYLTSIAGIQNIVNPYDQTGVWKVWHNGAWVPFATQTLAAATWYTFTLEADFIGNIYHFLTIEGGGQIWTFDLTAYHIAAEARGWTEESFVITVEGENLWNNCGTAGAFDYKMYYDQIAVWLQVHRAFLPHLIR